MYEHHLRSIEKLKEYFAGEEGVIALLLAGSVAKGNERPDSDLDAFVVVTDERYAELVSQNRLAEVITGYCTYEGGYFDIKYKTKEMLCETAERGSEPARNAFNKAQVLFSSDGEIGEIVSRISAYPENEIAEKIACFQANLFLNYGYFLNCVGEDNVYMRAHLAQEIVFSVYRLILIENRVLFPCNRRLEETVRACPDRPSDILDMGSRFLKESTRENADAFVGAFRSHTALTLTDDVSLNCSNYVKFYEEWWRNENAPFPNEM